MPTEARTLCEFRVRDDDAVKGLLTALLPLFVGLAVIALGWGDRLDAVLFGALLVAGALWALVDALRTIARSGRVGLALTPVALRASPPVVEGRAPVTVPWSSIGEIGRSFLANGKERFWLRWRRDPAAKAELLYLRLDDLEDGGTALLERLQALHAALADAGGDARGAAFDAIVAEAPAADEEASAAGA